MRRPPRVLFWFGALLIVCAIGSSAARGQDLSPADQSYLQNQARKVQTFLAQRNFARAAAIADRVVERLPDCEAAWSLVVECHVQPNWALRNDSRCEEAALRRIELGGRTPVNLRALAIAQFRQRRPEAVGTIAELVDGDDPKVLGEAAVELLVMRARMHIESGEPDTLRAARFDLDRALTIDPRHSSGRIERSVLFLDDGEFEQARDDLLVALQNRPGDRQVHFLLSRCYRGLREMDKARHHREVSSLINRLIDSMASTSAPDEEERLEILGRLRELNPGDGPRRMELSDLLIQRGELERAAAEVSAMQRDFSAWAPVLGLAERLKKAEQAEGGGDGA